MKNRTLETVPSCRRRWTPGTRYVDWLPASMPRVMIPARQAEVLQKARAVCLSHADLLPGALRTLPSADAPNRCFSDLAPLHVEASVHCALLRTGLALEVMDHRARS